MIWNIELQKNVNGIAFGTDRENVRKQMNLPFREIHGVTDDGLYEDEFGEHICCVEYDSSFKMTSITIYDTDNIFISGKKVFPVSISKYREFAEDLTRDEYDGYISRSTSIGISAPLRNILSVTFGKEDYYEFMFVTDTY